MRQGSSREAADGPVKKLLVLIKLNNMFGWRSIVQEIPPRFVTLCFVATSAAGSVKVGHGTLRRVRAGLKRTHSRSPIAGKCALFVQESFGTVMHVVIAGLLP
jgi:hypothetical protein